MTDPSTKYWSDIVDAAEVIGSIVKDMTGLNDYVKERPSKWAVERDLAIVGEAVGHLRRIGVTDLPPDADRIVAMRNRLIHSYDNVDDRIVWRLVKQYLPDLLAVARTHLKRPLINCLPTPIAIELKVVATV